MLEVTRLVLAKFDGTSKAVCAVAIAEELKLPIKLVGTGEKLENLEPRDVDAYVDKIFS